MTAGREPQVDAAAAADDLRRRLYREGATPEDLQRYLAERPREEQRPPEPVVQPRAGRGRRAAVGVGVVVAAAVLIATVQLVWTADVPVLPVPTATPEPALLQAIGEGRVLAVQQGSVSEPVAAAVEVRGAAVVGERFTGRGNAVVAVHPADGSRRGGHTSIELSSGGRTSVDWRALLTETRNETTTYSVVVARGTTSSDTGPTVFEYPRLPPTRIAVTAAPGVRWTLVVAVTGGAEPRLR